jgi:DNA repair photolyase
VVWLCPILPYINDTEDNINGILDYCIEAKVHGIICFSMGVTLREGDREYFYEKLDEHFPGMKERYIKQYGNSYEVTSPNNRKLMDLFKRRCSSHGIISDVGQCFQYLSEFEEKSPYEQLTLPGL